LRLAAGKRGGGLPELDVSQADIHQGFQFTGQGRNRFEQFQGVFHGHFQYVVDGVAFVKDVQCFPVVSFAVADIAGHIHIGQEVHFDFDQAIALAGFAAATAHVEAEAPGRIAARTRFRNLSEQFPQWRE
jgi:hypothetical protein